METAFRKPPVTYEELCRVYLSRKIRDKAECQRATVVIDALSTWKNLNKDQLDYLELVGDLVNEYEKDHVPHGRQRNFDPSNEPDPRKRRINRFQDLERTTFDYYRACQETWASLRSESQAVFRSLRLIEPFNQSREYPRANDGGNIPALFEGSGSGAMEQSRTRMSSRTIFKI